MESDTSTSSPVQQHQQFPASPKTSEPMTETSDRKRAGPPHGHKRTEQEIRQIGKPVFIFPARPWFVSERSSIGRNSAAAANTVPPSVNVSFWEHSHARMMIESIRDERRRRDPDNAKHTTYDSIVVSGFFSVDDRHYNFGTHQSRTNEHAIFDLGLRDTEGSENREPAKVYQFAPKYRILHLSLSAFVIEVSDEYLSGVLSAIDAWISFLTRKRVIRRLRVGDCSVEDFMRIGKYRTLYPNPEAVFARILMASRIDVQFTDAFEAGGSAANGPPPSKRFRPHQHAP